MTREEAIEKVRRMSLPKETMEILEALAPELRESEDERIRKHLVAIVEMYWGKTNDPDKAKDLAYLEKQKEHQNNSDAPNESSWSGMISSSDKDKNLDEIAQDYVDGVKEYNPEPTWDLVQTAVCYGYYLAEQKEQKPNIEICPHSIKSKSYKENFYPIEDCDYGLEIAYDILEKTFGEVRGYQTDDGIREHQSAIEAVRKAKEQKPAEWSEVDRHNLNSVISLVHGTTDGAWGSCIGDRIETWLKSLPERFNLQPKQERSEEDEKMLNDCIMALSNWRDAVANYGHEVAPCQRLIDWLKSLRPSWKPSEEQMKALKYAAYHMLPGEEYRDVLFSLFKDLKKLM